MNLKTIHTKDGRILYKDLDTGHWVNKSNAEKILSKQSDVREPQKEEQIAKAAEIAKKLNGVEEPEYERTPKMDFIQKRIDGKQKEIDKLNAKIQRIEAAKATNWEKNPYYYSDRDLASTQKEIDRAVKSLEDYKMDMQKEIEKAKSRNVPVITDFLNDWEKRSVEYFTDQKVRFDEAAKIRNTRNQEYSKWYYGDDAWKLKKEDPDAYKAKVKEQKDYRDKFDSDWRHVTQFFDGAGTWEENMHKTIAQEKIAKYDDIIARTNSLIGQITDAGALHIGKKGDLNGVIVGSKGKATVETIGAGGYNIQRYHFRTLINKLKEK